MRATLAAVATVMVSTLALPAQTLAAGTHGAASTGAETADSGRYGSAAAGMPYDREIRLGAQRSIGVWRLETINFVGSDGRSFRWRFDTVRQLDSFPLSRIAPAEVTASGDPMVYVNGEIPVAP